MFDALRRRLRARISPDPKFAEGLVRESIDDPRTQALARRLDAAERLADGGFEYAAVDPETGRLWVVDDSELGQGGSGARWMRAPDVAAAAALREDPTLLARAYRLRTTWPISLGVDPRGRGADAASSAEARRLVDRLDAVRPLAVADDGRWRVSVDPETGWAWRLDDVAGPEAAPGRRRLSAVSERRVADLRAASGA